MTHYVITRGSYSDYHIVAIYSDREEAYRVCKILNDRCEYEDYQIEEYEDSSLVRYENLNTYCVIFDNNETRVRENNSSDLEYCLKNEYWKYKDGTVWAMFVFANNKEKALKIASEKRAKLMAEQTGVV